MLLQPNVPIGVKLIQKTAVRCCPHLRINRAVWYRTSVLVLTFLAYTSFHLSRKSISVVKNVLNQNCTTLNPPSDVHITNRTRDTWCDWAPFDGSNAVTLLGALDSSFLFAYAFAMFGSGFVAERVNLRYFLALGMLLSGVFSYLFGIAYTYSIHSLWYFVVVQVLAGISQTAGWPGVVTVVGNWFGKSKRGLIFGIWNSHTSIGNILGSLIAGAFVETNWGLSFIVPGAIIGVVGFILFLFLVVNPMDVGCSLPDHVGSKIVQRNGYRRLDAGVADSSSDEMSSESETEIVFGEEESLTRPNEDTPILMLRNDGGKAIGFLGALRIPGVIEFSLCLFFSKLVSYTFLYWLPLYINSSMTIGAALSADMSTLFDVGGIVGGIVAGVITDVSGMSATTCAGMLALAAPMLFLYDSFGSENIALNIALLMIAGVLVNGPYSLITTAVSAELGTHRSLQGNSKALATVTAIIDGTGSIGAAVGPLLASVVSDLGWSKVFYMLIVSDCIALLLLSRLVFAEIGHIFQERKQAAWNSLATDKLNAAS